MTFTSRMDLIMMIVTDRGWAVEWNHSCTRNVQTRISLSSVREGSTVPRLFCRKITYIPVCLPACQLREERGSTRCPSD